MGIPGIYRELGPGSRESLAALSAAHYTAHSRCLRLAVDISIWLFQIQSGKGGSNPALRTFYYRLLRLLSLNIHPLFVFDGPNKPLYKRNKRVGVVQTGNGKEGGGGGGGYAKVASVPEFLAKQLLKQFGFPWHVAPGEAEAECALLQQQGIVDAVLSEDVDTLMFGSALTLRNWTPEGSTKSPSHVNVYRSKDVSKQSRGIDREGMVLVALMSGGDYSPEGVPGCGIKLACDAARAGFGKDLCALRRTDKAGLTLWKDRLLHQIRTNEAKYFSRKLKDFTLPEDFPNMEVLGWYARPSVSTPQRIEQMKQDLKWDAEIDLAALRAFAADAFDWRNLGGAKKFIRNLAPAMLVRKLRLRAELDKAEDLDLETREAAERDMIAAIHGKRNHFTVDGGLELRISFMPERFVPIDLSIEPEDDDFVPAGHTEDSDGESEAPVSSTPVSGGEEPETPRKRKAAPYDPSQLEKLWIFPSFLRLGCPLLVEDYEASLRDAKAFFQQRHQARAVAAGAGGGKISHVANAGNKKTRTMTSKDVADMPENALMQYVRVTKSSSLDPGLDVARAEEAKTERALRRLSQPSRTKPTRPRKTSPATETDGQPLLGELDEDSLYNLSASLCAPAGDGFRIPGSQQHLPASKKQKIFRATGKPNAMADPPLESQQPSSPQNLRQPLVLSGMQQAKKDSFFAIFAQPSSGKQEPPLTTAPIATTPKRQKKRRSAELNQTPSPQARKQQSMLSYCSVTPKMPDRHIGATEHNVIDLVSPSPMRPERASRAKDSNTRFNFARTEDAVSVQSSQPQGKSTKISEADGALETVELPASVTKRKKRTPLQKPISEPACHTGDEMKNSNGLSSPPASIADRSPGPYEREGGFLRDKKAQDDDDQITLRAKHEPFVSAPIEADGDVWGCSPSSTNDRRLQEWLLSVSGNVGMLNVPMPAERIESVPTGNFESSLPTPPPIDTFEVDEENMIKNTAALPPSKQETRKDQSIRRLERSGTALETQPSPCRRSPLLQRKGQEQSSPPSLMPGHAIATSTCGAAEVRSRAKTSTAHTEFEIGLPKQKSTKRALILRGSLPGAWKEVAAEDVLDLTGDGSGWKGNGVVAREGVGKGVREYLGECEASTKRRLAEVWRKSGVEVMDLTGE